MIRFLSLLYITIQVYNNNHTKDIYARQKYIKGGLDETYNITR